MITDQEYNGIEIPLEHSRSPRPDKVHIGLVQLSTDHTLENDWSRLSGESAMVFSNRVYYSSVLTPKALSEIAAGISRAADLIASGLPMDVMAFGCTSASMVIGGRKIEALLTEHHPGIPATNPWAAALAAFSHLRARKIAVFSPYPTAVNAPLYRALCAEGFEVTAIGALRIPNDTDITAVSRESLFNGAETLLAQGTPDAVFFSCTNLRILDHIDALESRFGLPIVTSNQAMFRHAMALAGKSPRCKGFGRLLAE